jgi:Xaa-Pro aminopeptidase
VEDSERFVDQRYTSVMHGVGMHGETPFIAHAIDYAAYGRDGHLAPGMVVSVESYIGEKDGREGVKLEDEVLITETGTELLSRFPYEDDFLGGPDEKTARRFRPRRPRSLAPP